MSKRTIEKMSVNRVVIIPKPNPLVVTKVESNNKFIKLYQVIDTNSVLYNCLLEDNNNMLLLLGTVVPDNVIVPPTAEMLIAVKALNITYVGS